MNGYIQIEINGNPVGIKFNAYALEQMQALKGNNCATKNLFSIIWAGILGNCYVKQIEPELSFEEVNDWFDEVFLSGDKDGILNKVAETFTESRVYKGVQPVKETKKKSSLISIESAA